MGNQDFLYTFQREIMSDINIEFDNLDAYQKLATVTANYNTSEQKYRLCNWSLGLCGEAGEFSELVKKHVFHGKDLDPDKAAKELGDVLWYLAVVAKELGFSLQDIAKENIAKLAARYPEGFKEGGGIR